MLGALRQARTRDDNLLFNSELEITISRAGENANLKRNHLERVGCLNIPLKALTLNDDNLPSDAAPILGPSVP